MFDTALLESRRDRKGRGKGAGLPLAIGLHVAVIGAFVGASVWSVGEPPEPVIPVTFFALRRRRRRPAGATAGTCASRRTFGMSRRDSTRGHRAADEPRSDRDELRAGRAGMIPVRRPAARRAIRTECRRDRRDALGRNRDGVAGRARLSSAATSGRRSCISQRGARLSRGRPARAPGRGGHPRGGDHRGRRGRRHPRPAAPPIRCSTRRRSEPCGSGATGRRR